MVLVLVLGSHGDNGLGYGCCGYGNCSVESCSRQIQTQITLEDTNITMCFII